MDPFALGKPRSFLGGKHVWEVDKVLLLGWSELCNRTCFWSIFFCCSSPLGAKNSTGSKYAASLYGRQQEWFEMLQLNKWSVYSQKIMIRTMVTAFIWWSPSLEHNWGVKTEENRHSEERSRVPGRNPFVYGPCQNHWKMLARKRPIFKNSVTELKRACRF